MPFAQMRYSIREGFAGLLRVKLLSLFSTLTIAAALISLGLYLMVVLNVQRIISQVRERVEIEAYLEDGLTAARIDSIRTYVAGLEGVESVRLISKEEAMDKLREEMTEHRELLEAAATNPLPASLQIRMIESFRQAKWVESVVRRLKPINGIEDIRYGSRELGLIESWIWVLTAIGLGIGLVVGLAAVLQIYHTVFQTVMARRQAIEIMWLIGATWPFIRRPFVIEGIIQSFMGSLVAAAALYGFFRLIPSGGVELVFLPPKFLGGLAIFGLSLGFIGSWFTARRTLRSLAKLPRRGLFR
jgi:cell division transport system permease protein